VLADTATVVIKPLGASAPAYPQGVPGWVKAIDTAIIGLLNVGLAIEVVFPPVPARASSRVEDLAGVPT